MYIYKITNLKTKEFYIGKREAWDGRPSLDKYMGSGKIIEEWKRNGTPMIKTILVEVDDGDLLNNLESVFINHYYNDDLCKNIARGTSKFITQENVNSLVDEWYTTSQAAELLKVSQGRVRQLVVKYRSDTSLVKSINSKNHVSKKLIELHKSRRDNFNTHTNIRYMGRGLAELIYDYDENGLDVPLGTGFSFKEYKSKPYYSVGFVAKQLGVTERAIQKRCFTDNLPKKHRKYVISKDVFEQWREEILAY